MGYSELDLLNEEILVFLLLFLFGSFIMISLLCIKSYFHKSVLSVDFREKKPCRTDRPVKNTLTSPVLRHIYGISHNLSATTRYELTQS